MSDTKTVTFDASQYQLVPKVPTQEMLDAASHASMQHLLDCINDPVKARELGSEENARKTHASRYQSMLAAAPTPAAQSAGQEAGTFVQGLEAAAKWLEKRAADYADEFGSIDPDTGTLEFGRGAHAEIKHETYYEWIECADGIRKIAAPVNGGERPPIEYRYEGGTHWCPLGPAEHMKPDFKGVYRLMAGTFPVWQGDEHDMRDEVTKALGLPIGGIRDGKPVSFAWSYLLGQIEQLVLLAERYAEESKCPGCEGKPAPQNNPCVVCGKRAADAQQVSGGIRGPLMDAQASLARSLAFNLRNVRDGEETLITHIAATAYSNGVQDAALSSPAKVQKDCPHAAPHRYCAECVETPCPIGLGEKK